MPESNPYQAPQTALTSAAVPARLQQLLPWEAEGRRALHDVAKQHRRMLVAYAAFLLYGVCCCISGYLGSQYLSKQAGDLLALQAIPLPLLYLALIYQVYQLAIVLRRWLSPWLSVLLMLLFPYSLLVPIIYHRRAVQFFAHFGIPLGLFGIRPEKLDRLIEAENEAFRRNSAAS